MGQASEEEERLAFAYILKEINDTESAMDNSIWFLLGGIGAFLLGLLLVWLCYTGTTILYLGRTRVVLGATYAITGVIFAFLGLVLMPLSIHTKLRSPEKLRQLRSTLEKMKKAKRIT